jgi:hypothetical protein
MPESVRLEKMITDAGDYEQLEPSLYSYLSYPLIMLASGSKGSYYIYNEKDPCCFRVQKNSSFIDYLMQFNGVGNRKIGFFIDQENVNHSASIRSLDSMQEFMDKP